MTGGDHDRASEKILQVGVGDLESRQLRLQLLDQRADVSHLRRDGNTVTQVSVVDTKILHGERADDLFDRAGELVDIALEDLGVLARDRQQKLSCPLLATKEVPQEDERGED